MTVRAMAVGDGSAVRAAAQPVGVNTHARTREAPRSVTHRERVQVGGLRRAGRIMWLDAADSWIVRDSSPAPATVWATDYTAHLDDPGRLYVAWCRLWRIPATVAGSVLDSAKFLIIHPARGPLALSTAVALYEIATH